MFLAIVPDAFHKLLVNIVQQTLPTGRVVTITGNVHTRDGFRQTKYKEIFMAEYIGNISAISLFSIHFCK